MIFYNCLRRFFVFQRKNVYTRLQLRRNFSEGRSTTDWSGLGNKLLIGSCAVSILFYFNNNCYMIMRVSGISMQPTINPTRKANDFVLIDQGPKKSHKKVRRGDIIIYRTPRDPNSINIKRVVGLEDDVITTLGYKTRHVVVPKGHCWVEGDNHKFSDDSNNVGPIPLGLVTGRATHVVFPPSRCKKLERKLPHKRLKICPNSDNNLLRSLPNVLLATNDSVWTKS